MKSPFSLWISLVFVCGLSAKAAHPFICCDSYGNKVAVVSQDGNIEWEYKCEHPQDCWKLADGNYLFCHKSGAIEMTPDKQIAWEYKAPPKTEIHACQPLPDGRVLVVEAGTCRILEIDRDGKIAKEIKLPVPPAPITVHDQFRGTRKIKNGHYLVSCKGEHKVVELDAEGKSVREIKTPGDVHEVVALPDGNLLIDCGDGHRVIELDGNEKIVWELTEKELAGNPLRLVAWLPAFAEWKYDRMQLSRPRPSGPTAAFI